ncbi:MAG: HypC/HybG/HupF family hydrogenase formation chaperone [Actinobacteria bacterium]|nr:HypC/HybG/HupF family hydrogenase formation chaperone [Actinomycetota bacterium]
MCLAVPAEVTALEGFRATVSVGGALREVDVSLVDGVSVGDYVLVHAGFALHRWEYSEVLEWREIMGELIDAEEQF